MFSLYFSCLSQFCTSNSYIFLILFVNPNGILVEIGIAIIPIRGTHKVTEVEVVEKITNAAKDLIIAVKFSLTFLFPLFHDFHLCSRLSSFQKNFKKLSKKLYIEFFYVVFFQH